MILPDTGYNNNRRPSVPMDFNLGMQGIKKVQVPPPMNNGDSHLVQHHNMMMQQQPRQFIHQNNF